MNQINCPICGNKCVKAGKTKAGTQRWLCKKCKTSLTHKIDNDSKELQIFLDWLFGKETQSIMPGEGRTFRRKTARFWDIWPMPPKIEETKDVLFLDGIYLGRKACVLICCDEKNVLGWYLCRYEHAGAWIALMKRIAEPRMVVSDGGTGFAKALKKVWPIAKHQRCIFHVFCQIKRYTTSKPNTLAGVELYCLAKDLLKIKEKQEAETWVTRFTEWIKKYQKFLSEGIHGRTNMPEDEPPDGVAQGSLEHLCFITFTVAIDYLRDAPTLWNNSRRTFSDPETRYLFYPKKLEQVGFEKVVLDMQKHGLSKKPERTVFRSNRKP